MAGEDERVSNNASGVQSKQILSPETTGLSQYQLNVLAGLSKKARQAFKDKEFELSEDLCRKCIDIYPSFAAPFAILGRIADSYKKFELAATYFEKTLEILPDVPGRLIMYSNVLIKLARPEEALRVIEKYLELTPNAALARCNRAVLLVILGRIDEGIDVYEALMEELPLFTRPFHNISALVKFEKGDKYSKTFEKLEINVKEMSPDAGLIDARYALGKYYEDLGEYKTGFEHFLAANKMLADEVQYNLEDDIASLAANITKFPKKGRWLREVNIGSSSRVPILIVGMPRSGTTLTEQILANHPQIHGAGELTFLGKIGEEFSEKIKDEEAVPIDPIELERFRKSISLSGKELADAIIAKSPDARHVIDKMPHNFLQLGYKHLLMPNAKVIHCKRNPIDTCLSSFRIQFRGNLHFTTNLMHLGKYYVAYSLLMDHWKEVLPDQILDVLYEDVIDDVEGQARRMVEFIGLEWNDACLKFYENKRAVSTASLAQVRQPIYKTAVGRYERYGDMLKPLLDALEPVL